MKKLIRIIFVVLFMPISLFLAIFGCLAELLLDELDTLDNRIYTWSKK